MNSAEILSLAVRPLILIAMFASAALLAWVIRPFIPGGNFKEFIYQKRDLTDNWVIGFCLAFTVIALFIGAAIAFGNGSIPS